MNLARLILSACCALAAAYGTARFWAPAAADMPSSRCQAIEQAASYPALLELLPEALWSEPNEEVRMAPTLAAANFEFLPGCQAAVCCNFRDVVHLNVRIGRSLLAKRVKLQI